jgi:uncharacterized protein with HEPN domain/predicted nucleotidyltransferase
MNIIDQNIDKIHDLCSKHKVAKLFVFGSVLSEKFKKNSDIDFIVDFRDFDVYDYADNYFDLKYSLENILKRNVDLLEDKAINIFVNRSILQSNSFMDNEIKTWLYDVLQSIREIDSYYEDKPKRYADYLIDTKTKRAVERNIEIIGEAVSRILKKDKNFKLENAQKIIGTRNRIVHGYDKISDELIWSILINNLPKLREEVDGLLK